MAYFLDPEHWLIRGGEAAKVFGDPYTYSFQGQVQHDRSFYLYNVVGDLPVGEVTSIVRHLQELGRVYGWKQILWERIRKNGTIHLAKIPIKKV